MKQAFDLALEQTERSLGSIDWNSYGSILFISKSIGTVISSAYASRHDLTVKASCSRLLQRPFPSHLPEASPSTAPQILWAETDSIRELAAQKDVPLFLTQNANHSLETGDVLTDIFILKTTMERVQRFI